MMKCLVTRFIEALNNQNWEALSNCLADNLVRHSSAAGEFRTESRDSFIDFVRQIAEAFPDLYHQIHLTVSEDDMLACYFTIRGTQTGDFGSFAASEKRVDMPYVAFFRVEAGRISEMWVEWDNLCFLSQLGHFRVS